MRIYAHTILKKNVLTNIEPFYYETRQLNYISRAHSDSISTNTIGTGSDDLYQVEQNKIYYIRCINSEKQKTLFGAHPITIDYTEFIKEDECYQVPVKYKNQFFRHKVFKSSPSSLVEWVFVYENDQLKENYFYVPAREDINSSAIKADLLWCLNGGINL